MENSKKIKDECIITGVLNKTETDRLFESEAILVGKSDVMPYETAVRLLGASAVKYASKPGEDYNEHWLGNEKDRMRYLYKSGFYKAVTYHNVMFMAHGCCGELSE